MPAKRSRSSTSPSDDGIAQTRTHAGRAGDARGTSDRQHSLRIYIIPAKLLPGALEDLVRLVDDQAGAQTVELTADSDRADVIVTAVRTRSRFERHVRWEVAKTKAIVTPDWLKDSVNSGTIQPCGKYAALGDLVDETEGPCGKLTTTLAPLEAPPSLGGQLPTSIDIDPEENLKDGDLEALDYLAPLCCRRPSPLACPNQALVEQLCIIRDAKLFEGEERSMLSYARAIATIKAYPYRFDELTSREDIAKLPYLGTKLTAMVEEFIKTGKISKAQEFLSSERFLSLSLFNTIHGIGALTARHLYSLGLRSLEDLEKYYEVTPGMTHKGTSPDLDAGSSEEVGVERSIQISLSLRHDLSQKIPRWEVEEINRVIMRELEWVETGCKSIIAGSYRRGKPEGNDVDIVVSHTDWDRGADKMQGLCKKLVQRLCERGLVKHVLNMSGYHPRNIFRTHHWDSLEKALTVFVLPDDPARKQTYRRVDIIFAVPGVFWTAVVGWTGSTMFQRDLRLWANKRGLKFDSSGILHDSRLFHPKTEREVFELLGLKYVHPVLRNADI